MRLFELGPRLGAAADFVARGARFADIGSDHGKLPVQLIKTGVIDRALVTDLRDAPLGRARKTAAAHGVADRITFLRGDGLRPVDPGSVDCIAVCGMGGETIAGILDAASWALDGAHTLILQPMRTDAVLRRYLYTAGARIADERLAEEGGRIYAVLSVRGRERVTFDLADCFVGRRAQSSPLFGRYCARALRYLRESESGLRHRGSDEAALYAEAIAKIERMGEPDADRF